MHLGRAGRPCRLGLCRARRRGGLPAAPVHAQRGAGVVGQHRRWRVGADALAMRWRATLRLRRRCALCMEPAPSPNPNPNPNSSHTLTLIITLTRRALRMEPARPAAPCALRHLPGAGRLDSGDRESPLRRHEPRRPARLPPARPGGGAHRHIAPQPKRDLNEI